MCDKAQTSSKQNHSKSQQQRQQIANDSQSMQNQFFQSLDCSKISFFDRSDSKKTQIPPKQRLKILINKKRQTLAALQTLEDQQKKIKADMLPIKTKLKHKKVQRYEGHEDNKKLIKDLIQQSKVFETSIVNKIKNLEEENKKELIKQRNEQIKNISFLRQQRHRKAEQKIRKIKQRQTDRQQFRQKSIQRVKQLHSKSYIFEKFTKLEKQEQKKTISPIKKQVATINEILEHQKRYKSLTKQDSHQRKEKIKSFKKQFNKRSTKKYPEGRIASLLREQKQEEKNKQLQKQAFAERYLNRVSQYGKIVRELYHPRIKQRQKTETSESKGTTGLKRQKQTKSVEQLKQLGDNYLAYNKVHRAKKSLDINMQYKQTKQSKIKYKDYLKQMKPRIVTQNFSSKFDHMMNEQKLPDKIFKLRNLLRDEEQKYPEPNQDKLKELTNAKLAIINYIL